MSEVKQKVGESSSGEVINGFWSCRDLTDVVPLHTPRGLYLKPIAKINVSVNLPQLKTPGKTISTWEVMEKIRGLVLPDEFASLKVAKSTLEFIRLEGDLSDRCRLQRVLARLDSQRLNLAGFPNVLKVRVAEAKDDFPTRHAWDSYFRDAKHMNELKPGERPDTVHISGLPVKWFSEDGGDAPSEPMVARVFKKWGPLRRVDVPAADAYRPRMRLGNNIQKFSFGDGIFFDAYIQYVEYMDFVKAMDAMRGMKLLKKEAKNCLTAVIKVDFDKTKHMSDSSVSHREFERKRLIAQDSLAAEKLRKKEELEAQRKEESKKKEAADKEAKENRRRLREEKRKRKALRVFRKQEEDKVSMKIAREEQKLIKAQRQLESIRLLDELFDRIKVKVEKKEIAIGEKVEPTGTKVGDKKVDKANDQESHKSGEKDNEKKSEKKNKKLKKKKSKKEKKKKKKHKKNKDSGSESSNADTDDEAAKKKIKSVLTVNNSKPSSAAGSARVDGSVDFPQIYPRFPQAWYYEAALPMLYSSMGRGGHGSRGGPTNRFQRGRGRGYAFRRGGNRGAMRTFDPHIYNEQYYKYFANLAGQDYPNYESEYEDESSKSRSRTRDRSRTRSRTRDRSRTRSRRRSRRRRRSSSGSGSTSDRSRSRRTRGRSSRSSRSRSRTRTRTRTSSGGRSSRSKRSRTKSRSQENFRNRKNRRKRSRSRVMVTRAKSRSVSAKRRSRSSSWSMPKSPRRRSCSWSKVVDEGSRKSDKKQPTETAKLDESTAAKKNKNLAPSSQTEVITPD